MSTFNDITGQQFGRLTVIERRENNRHGKTMWRCQCACGASDFIVLANSLTAGRTLSCGCIQLEQLTKRNVGHNLSKHPLYPIWLGMMQRCHNPRSKPYVYYGSRGITVCERWHSVENFIADIAPRPSAKHTLDRINNDRGYSPDNCRWATRSEQRDNQRPLSHQRGQHRTNRIITAFNKSLHLAEWAKQTGIHRATISTRLRAGWPPEKALTP
jgi:hypothetical protein